MSEKFSFWITSGSSSDSHESAVQDRLVHLGINEQRGLVVLTTTKQAEG